MGATPVEGKNKGAHYEADAGAQRKPQVVAGEAVVVWFSAGVDRGSGVADDAIAESGADQRLRRGEDLEAPASIEREQRAPVGELARQRRREDGDACERLICREVIDESGSHADDWPHDPEARPDRCAKQPFNPTRAGRHGVAEWVGVVGELAFEAEQPTDAPAEPSADADVPGMNWPELVVTNVTLISNAGSAVCAAADRARATANVTITNRNPSIRRYADRAAAIDSAVSSSGEADRYVRADNRPLGVTASTAPLQPHELPRIEGRSLTEPNCPQSGQTLGTMRVTWVLGIAGNRPDRNTSEQRLELIDVPPRCDVGTPVLERLRQLLHRDLVWTVQDQLGLSWNRKSTTPRCSSSNRSTVPRSTERFDFLADRGHHATPHA